MTKQLTYKDAGVDIEAGYQAVKQIKDVVKQTWRPEVRMDLGGFGGAFALNMAKYNQPVLISGTDGVGTKLKVAFMQDKHDTVGIDLVAMCVNDILAQGAEPLFFLDYLATGKLNPDTVTSLVTGVAAGCKEAGCALIGGETAEMPGFYQPGEYDMAGFAVGIVEEDRVLPRSLNEKHMLIGLVSSGIHSNGFSLARKVAFEVAELAVDDYLPELGCSIGEELLKPTRIYVKEVWPLLDNCSVDGVAHITGGGFTENIPRMLSDGYHAEINLGSWPISPIFGWLQKQGNIAQGEMFNTFNMGIGLVLAVQQEQVDNVLTILNHEKHQAYLIGRVCLGEGGVIYHD